MVLSCRKTVNSEEVDRKSEVLKIKIRKYIRLTQELKREIQN